MSTELTINLGERSYPILLGHGVASGFGRAMHERFAGRRIVLVTNTTLARLYRCHLDEWRGELDFVEFAIPDGEEHKTLATWSGVIDAFFEAKLDRQAVVIAFGGGVVGDITGFAAAAYLRGVDFVQVPTTLLAMVDSSVGGKTGVNHALGKNLIGAFHQPRLVWVDTAYLGTLADREFVAGYAELYKNAFIGGREMFDFVGTQHAQMLARERGALVAGIERSLKVKAAVVESDERETGQRALLNFGHTFAHAFERAFGYDRILHGEAVLWGIACAYDLGARVGTIARTDRGVYDSLLAKLPLPALPTPVPAADILYKAMFTDKKTQAGALRFVLPAEPGVSVVRGDIASEKVVETLRTVLGRADRGAKGS